MGKTRAPSAGGCFPSARRGITAADADRVIAALQAEHLNVTEEVLRSTIETWGSAALAKLGSDVAFNVRNPIVADWLDSFRSVTLKDINDTTADGIRDVIQSGVEQGLGTDEIARNIGDVFDEARGYRAEMIARTETGSAMNAANLSAYQLSGMVDGKEWLSVQDSSTRESHLVMDGERVPITGMFVSPNGGRASAPGQFGIAEEDINCRCTVLPVVAEMGLAGVERAAVWKLFDDSVDTASKKVLDAFRAGFSEQERRVLVALDHAS